MYVLTIPSYLHLISFDNINAEICIIEGVTLKIWFYLWFEFISTQI